jgi:hypothetical protein
VTLRSTIREIRQAETSVVLLVVQYESEPPVVAVLSPPKAHLVAGRLNKAANDTSASKASRAAA